MIACIPLRLKGLWRLQKESTCDLWLMSDVTDFYVTGRSQFDMTGIFSDFFFPPQSVWSPCRASSRIFQSSGATLIILKKRVLQKCQGLCPDWTACMCVGVCVCVWVTLKTPIDNTDRVRAGGTGGDYISTADTHSIPEVLFFLLFDIHHFDESCSLADTKHCHKKALHYCSSPPFEYICINISNMKTFWVKRLGGRDATEEEVKKIINLTSKFLFKLLLLKINYWGTMTVLSHRIFSLFNFNISYNESATKALQNQVKLLVYCLS